MPKTFIMKLMPPQNPAPYTPQPPAPSQTPYDFMLNQTPQRGKFSMKGLGGQSLKQRLLIVGGVVVILIIFAVILSSLLGGSNDTLALIAVAQDQNELARVAGEANGEAAQQATQNLGESVQLSIASAQLQLTAYMKRTGQSTSNSQLGATKNTKTDAELTAAEAASDYDVVFTQVMQAQLNKYEQDIKTAFPTAGPKGKVILQADYDGAKLLLTQANDLASALQAS
jgi:hypothetical protein